MDPTTLILLVSFPVLLLLSGALVFTGFYLCQRAQVAGRSDIVKVLGGMRTDTLKASKQANDNVRYFANLIAAKDPMALQQLEQVSMMTNSPEPSLPEVEPDGPLHGEVGSVSDYEESISEAKRLGIKIPSPMI
jgi:hypothetical protein